MTSIAEIGIRVDSSEAVQATDNLDKMTDAGKRSEDSVKRTGKAWEQAIGGMATNTQQIVKELQNLNAKQDATAQMMAKIGSSISSASSSFQSAAASMGSYRAQNDALVVSQGKAAQSTEKASKAAKQHADDLSALLGKIDPTVAALGRLDDMQEQLSKFKSKGLIDPETFRDYSSRIDASRQKLGDFDEGLRKTGVSSAQTTAALRQLPAQFTDIFTSLAGGQNPLMVLIQQGGQIKDSFGGIGETFDALKSKFSSLFAGGAGVSALGESLAGVAAGASAAGDSAEAAGASLDGMAEGANNAADAAKNAKEASAALGLTGVPVSAGLGLIVGAAAAATAAIGALIYGYSQGSKEADEYNKALILSGNAAGTSASQLAELAKQVSATNGTTGDAAESLAKLAAGGVVASASFKDVADAAAAMEDATGRSVDATIAEFVKIAQDPVAAAKSLNDQYHFLTASVYSQITALKEQGDTIGAADLLTKTYADTVQSRSGQVTENLGLWEKAWKGVKDAASLAVDGLKEAGREKSYADQIDELKARLTGSAAFDVGGLRMNPGAVSSKEKADIQGQINFIELQRDADQARTQFLADQDKAQKDSIAAMTKVDAITKSAWTNEQKRTEALKDYKKQLDDIRKTNPQDKRLDQSAIDKNIANIKEQFKDAAQKKSAPAVDLSGFNDAQNKLKLITSEYDNAQQKLNAAQKSGLLSQKDYSEQSAALVEQEKGRVTAAYQAEIDALEAAKGKKSTSAEQRIALDQKIADARTNMVKAQQDADTQLNVLSTNEEGRLKKQAAAVQTYIDALDDQLATTKKQLALSVSGVGMGDEARKRLQEDIKIQQEYQDKLDKLLAQKNKNQIDEGVYQQQTAAVRQALAQRLEMQKEYYGAVEAEQTNWLNGASSAYATYLEQVKDVAGQTKSAFTSAFKSLEDVLVSFATTGKASFKDFADSIIADFARIAIKSKVMPAILGAVGLSGSDQAAGGGSGSGANGMLGLASGASKLYSFASSGLGGAVSSGWSAGNGVVGGIEGAFKAGSTYVSDSITSAFANTSVGLSSQASASLAAGSSQAGYASIGAGSEAAASMAVGASQAGYGASAGASAAASGLTATGAATYGIGGAIMGYQQAGLKGAATGAGGAMAGAYAGAQVGSFAGPIGTAIGAALGAVLGGTIGSSIWGGDWQTKDQGLSLGVENGDFAGQKYEDQKKKGGLFGKNKSRTRLSALDPEMQKSLDSAYSATESSVLTLFDRLNVKLNDGVLDGLNIASQQISTKDKTAEQIQAEITKWFGGVADFMTVAVANATGSGTAGYDFEALTEFVNNLYGVNDVIKHLNVGLFDMSVTGGFMAEQLSAWAGGFEALKTSAATYYDNFFTDAEKSANTLSDVRKEFENLGITLPETRQGYRDMVEGIDRTTEAGRAMFVTLLGLSGDAAQAFTILEANADKAKQTLADMLNSAVTGASGLVQRSVNAEKDAATKAYNARMTSLNDMSETAQKSVSDMTGVSNSLENALKSLRGTSDDAVKMLRSQAQATLQSALATARAGGSLAGFTGLEDALSTVSTNNTDLYASLEDFNREQGRTANVVAELNTLNGKQLTSAEQLLESIKDQIKQEKDQFDLQIEKFDEQLKLAQTQIDALNGIDNSVISVAAAMSGLSASIAAALAAKPAGSAAANNSENNSTLLNAVYQSVLGRDLDAAGAAYWGGLLKDGKQDYAGLVDAITKDAKANGEIKGHATGGLISGPGTGTSDSIIRRLSNGEYVLTANAVRTYGTDLLDQMNAGNLPTLACGGAQVRNYNASQTAATLNGSGDSAAAIAELRRQLAEIYSGLAIMNKHMEKTAYNTSEMNNSGVQVINTVKTEAA